MSQSQVHSEEKIDMNAVTAGGRAGGGTSGGTNDDTTEVRLPGEAVAINPKLSALRQNRGSKEYQEGIKRLATQLKEEGGQKQPVTIRINTTDGSQSYELVAGHRRYDAAKLAGVDLVCRFEDLTDEEAMRWARRENFSREDFSPMEKARIIVAMRIDKMSTKEIALDLGVSPATVTQTEKLLNMPLDVQQAIEEGRLTPSAALELTAVKPEKREKVIEEARQVAVKETVEEAERQAERQEKKAKTTGKTKDVKSAKEAREKVEQLNSTCRRVACEYKPCCAEA